MNDVRHTHYSPYGPPRQVEGTLLDCTAPDRDARHTIEDSELSADYPYSPRFGLPSASGLPEGKLVALFIAYLAIKVEGIEFRVADVVTDPEYTYRVRITHRTSNPHGPAWHSEHWGLTPEGAWQRIVRNPHPGYEHWPAFCPNCGY
jgi:hypothetical protein